MSDVIAPWDEMKLLLKQCHLTYNAAALLAGVSIFTMKSWLKPATGKSGYEVPSYMLEYFRLLASNDFQPADGDIVTSSSMQAALFSSSTLSSAPENLRKIAYDMHGVDLHDIGPTVDAARRLIAKARIGTILRLLMQAVVKSPVAYGFQSGGATIALLTPDAPCPPFVTVSFIQQIDLPGRSFIEAPAVAFEFNRPILDWTVTAADDVEEAVKPADDPSSAPSLQMAYLPNVYAVLVAHAIRTAGIEL